MGEGSAAPIAPPGVQAWAEAEHAAQAQAQAQPAPPQRTSVRGRRLDEEAGGEGGSELERQGWWEWLWSLVGL